MNSPRKCDWHKISRNKIDLQSPDNGMHSLPSIDIVALPDRLEDGKIVALLQLLSVQHVHKPDDRIFCMEISNRIFHENHNVPNTTKHSHDPSIHALFSHRMNCVCFFFIYFGKPIKCWRMIQNVWNVFQYHFHQPV